MEVDNRNFEEALPLCLKAVDEADFVGLDLEMTGITLPDSRITLGDSPEIAYRKMKAVAERFNIVQVGVCPMVKQPPSTSSSGGNSSSSVYVSTPFTFYIFPRPVRYESLYHNALVTLCADATHFHRKNRLDFGRWVNNGISYVNAEMEEKARQRAAVADAEDAGGAVNLLTCPSANAMEPKLGLDKLTSADQKESVENSLKQLREAIAKTDVQKTEGGSIVANGHDGEQNAQQRREEDSELDRQRLVSFPVLSQLTAEVLVCCIWSEFGDSVLLRETRWNRGYRRKLEAFRASPETNARLQMCEVERKEKGLRGLVGFRMVWSKLVASQKLTVLHNGLFDLLFLFAAFEGPLPSRLAELKTLKHRLLPHTIDTKAISTLLPNRFRKGTSLEEVAANIQAAESTEACNFKFPAGFIDYDANSKGSPPVLTENGQTAKVPKTQDSGQQEGPKSSNAEGKEGVPPLTKTTALAPAPPPPPPAASFHNAGYDAYQTARTFAALCADGELKRELFEEVVNKYLLGRCIKLVNFNVHKPSAVSSPPPPHPTPACSSPAGLDFQPDELICGNDGFVLWLGDFPKNYTVEELHNILGSQEMEEAVRRWGSVAIRWIDDTSVFLVGFKGGHEYRDQLERYLRLKEAREGNFKCKLPDEVFQELDKALHQRPAAPTC